ncbi:aminoglycoside phosphotransferase family protein [Nocardia jinanensis]|uniref:Aminoglycoside O-phosphotransferase n=1 Tax=Nocardia jinanensis TaxID=382504 RepID=A0A917RVE3_9NOCA|nr:aminoglycoside phosphotransferase family protein [Nocardia jinanensis]GGL35761.1 aminoglycoside O-phosphotransferase [Nocardia jinanensis]
MTISLPPDVVDNIRTIFTERGERWLAQLPATVARLCRDWELEVIGASFTGGTHSFVAPVRRADGGVAVLKVPVIDEEDAGEAAGMYCYRGEGAAYLYEFDPDSRALLLEWARPGTPLVGQPPIPLEGRPEHADAVQAACALYRRLRRPPTGLPSGYPPLPLVSDIVADWSERLTGPALLGYLTDELAGPARDRCAAMAVPDGPELIVNRDTHLGNIVASEREPWLLIDPKAYLGEAAFDAGFLILKMVESHPDPDPRIAHRMVAAAADGLEVDRERARGWAFLRAVEEIAWSLEDDRPGDAARYRRVAAALS